jgi:hypothetical protein
MLRIWGDVTLTRVGCRPAPPLPDSCSSPERNIWVPNTPPAAKARTTMKEITNFETRFTVNLSSVVQTNWFSLQKFQLGGVIMSSMKTIIWINSIFAIAEMQACALPLNNISCRASKDLFQKTLKARDK